MLARVVTAALHGVEARPVWVEVSLTRGLPAFTVVGLAEGAVREGRERVLAALRHAQISLPPRRITVNLAPADLRKEGTGFDLAVAVGLLVGAGVVPPASVEGTGFFGELGLDGSLRAVRGALVLADGCRAAGVHRVIAPPGNGAEVAGVEGLEVVAPATLTDLVDHLSGRHLLDPIARGTGPAAPGDDAPDLVDVQGQEVAKRALEVAAAGGHNLLMFGPPGSGKTLLARRLPGILPPLAFGEALEVTRVHSVAGRLPENHGLVTGRPFRAPHHTVSYVGMAGGGSPPRPGEVSLAHHGVLFLDELPEFQRQTLEVLRQPLEEGAVTVARARGHVRFPASFMLVAAMNPCPCGFHGDGTDRCTCDPGLVARYRGRVSGPLLDRIDLILQIGRVSLENLHRAGTGEPSAEVRRRVGVARDAQRRRGALQGRAARQEGGTGADVCNARLPLRDLLAVAPLAPPSVRFLRRAAERLDLSARGYHRVLRVARTIADLEGADLVVERHLAEALQYRQQLPSGSNAPGPGGPAARRSHPRAQGSDPRGRPRVADA